MAERLRVQRFDVVREKGTDRVYRVLYVRAEARQASPGPAGVDRATYYLRADGEVLAVADPLFTAKYERVEDGDG